MTTKKTSSKAAPRSPKSPNVRPPLELPFEVPESIRVDPGTAMAEWLKTQYPDAPAPIFSTKALMHGHEAVGAQRIRPGFSFNPQMDLLWALGFPEVAFIIDGVPVPNTVEALKKLYDTDVRFAHRTDRHYWFRAQLETGRLYTRPGAMARVWECDPFARPVPEAEREDYAQSIFEQTDEDAEKTIRYRELDRAAVRKALLGSAYTARLEEDSLLLEALAGPDLVADVLVEFLELGTTKHANYELCFALLPISLRLRPVDLEQLQSRIAVWAKKATESDKNLALGILDPDAYARGELETEGEIGSFRMYLSREWEALITKEATKEASLQMNDPFTGDRDKILSKIVRSHKGWEILDIDNSYLANMSAIRSPLILPPLLAIGAQKWSRAPVRAWLVAHGNDFRLDLEKLAKAKDAKVAALATQALKLLP